MIHQSPKMCYHENKRIHSNTGSRARNGIIFITQTFWESKYIIYFKLYNIYQKIKRTKGNQKTMRGTTLPI